MSDESRDSSIEDGHERSRQGVLPQQMDKSINVAANTGSVPARDVIVDVDFPERVLQAEIGPWQLSLPVSDEEDSSLSTASSDSLSIWSGEATNPETPWIFDESFKHVWNFSGMSVQDGPLDIEPYWIPWVDRSTGIPNSDESTRSEDDPRYKCLECGISFHNSYSLEQHAKAENHRTYICQISTCGKKFSRLDSYNRHKASHTKPEAHICLICAQDKVHKAFRRKDHLSQHKRNCHSESERRNKSLPPCLSCQQNPCANFGRCITPLRGMSPASTFDERHIATPTGMDIALPERSNNARTSLSYATLPQSDAVTYQSSAVREIVDALKTRFGEDNTPLRILEQCWDLHCRTTTEQLAESLAFLATAEPGILARCSRSIAEPVKRKAIEPI